MNWTFICDIAQGVAPWAIYPIAAFAFLKANPPTEEERGLSPLMRFARLTQRKRKDYFCGVAIITLSLLLCCAFGTAQYYDAQWTDAVDYIVQMRGEKEAVEAQNARLQAENAALKERERSLEARLAQAEARAQRATAWMDSLPVTLKRAIGHPQSSATGIQAEESQGAQRGR